MLQKKKSMGIVAIESVWMRFVHPSLPMGERCANAPLDDGVSACIALRKEERIVTTKDSIMITFRPNDVENIVLYAVECYSQIKEEGPVKTFFKGIESVAVTAIVDHNDIMEDELQEDRDYNNVEQIENANCRGELMIDGELLNFISMDWCIILTHDIGSWSFVT